MKFFRRFLHAHSLRRPARKRNHGLPSAKIIASGRSFTQFRLGSHGWETNSWNVEIRINDEREEMLRKREQKIMLSHTAAWTVATGGYCW